LKFEYDRLVDAPVSTVWAVLTDPSKMEPHLPGTAKVVATGSDRYRISMKISMGFLRPTVNADVQLADIIELEFFVIELSGKSMGAGVAGNAAITLSAATDQAGSTRVTMNGTVQTSGLLSKVPDPKIETAARGFLESYFTSVERASAAL
jgi:carbon monoxide dehydrogenase subunit G